MTPSGPYPRLGGHQDRFTLQPGSAAPRTTADRRCTVFLSVAVGVSPLPAEQRAAANPVHAKTRQAKLDT